MSDISVVNNVDWITDPNILPPQRDSIFKKFKGTNKWTEGMFEQISDEVIVTLQFSDGKRITTTDRLHDNQWSGRDFDKAAKVVAWAPMPEPWKGEIDG